MEEAPPPPTTTHIVATLVLDLLIMAGVLGMTMKEAHTLHPPPPTATIEGIPNTTGGGGRAGTEIAPHLLTPTRTETRTTLLLIDTMIGTTETGSIDIVVAVMRGCLILTTANTVVQAVAVAVATGIPSTLDKSILLLRLLLIVIVVVPVVVEMSTRIKINTAVVEMVSLVMGVGVVLPPTLPWILEKESTTTEIVGVGGIMVAVVSRRKIEKITTGIITVRLPCPPHPRPPTARMC